ncbi:uncharacterized protein LOC128092468 [Culex pipiens pallens]|uniref:uncharacterized protein LOC128092468 n=1 Tax=Culex pipiens pallens TaxID=42434 RepID=UPI0022AB1964|nr:uncharacterized protein LOC128092468 [Culex pipiens pallens]XP_052562303.1 uncharacterized protein LOC128092468 [Culex pipiens pallens]
MSTVTIDTHILYALLSKASNLGQAGKDLGLDVCTIWPRVDVPLNFVTQLKRCADDLSKIARENDEPGYLEIQRATFPYPPQGRDGRRSRTPYRVDHGRHESGRYQQFRNTRSESRGYELEDNFNAPGTKVYQRQQVVIDHSAEDGDKSDGSNNAAREQEADYDAATHPLTDICQLDRRKPRRILSGDSLSSTLVSNYVDLDDTFCLTLE